LADIFPTGWHGVTLSGFLPGETVAVFGGGPVGLMAAYSAVIRGASRVFVVDRVKERLQSAEKIGCTAINFEDGDAVEMIIKSNGGEMVDRSVDAVGYQAVVKGGDKEQPNIVLENMIKVTRACGGLGIPGTCSFCSVLETRWNARQIVPRRIATHLPPRRCSLH